MTRGAPSAIVWSALLISLLAPSSQAAAQLSPIRPTPMHPSRYAPSEGDECYARERGPDGVVAQDRICDGPRRVPRPTGEAAARAERLGLGTRPAADRLRIGSAPDAWLEELRTARRSTVTDEAAPSAALAGMLWPVARGLFSRGFGYVRREEIHHRRHDGVDIVAEEGAHIRAVDDALVVYADNGVSGYGNLLILLHADGSATFYGHCRAIYVAPGQLVARGQAVAEVGATGRPVVPHLHFEWRRHGRALDPMPRFVERPPADTIRPDADTRDFLPPPPNHFPARSR